MYVRVCSVRLNTRILCLLLFVAGASLYFLRIRYSLVQEFFIDDNQPKSRHLTFPDGLLHNDDRRDENRILSGKFHSRESMMNRSENKWLISEDDQDKDRHIETNNISLHEIPSYPLFQSAEEKEFPTTEGNLPRIPHIIHQMYTDEMIPEMYVNHIKSFIKHNPTWEYRFWTDESGRRLLQKRHPYLVQVYDKFGSNVKRSDLLRYAVLYEYGGFYADLDMDNLRSLNITTMKYACIVPVEPFEHSALLNNMLFLMNNAVLSCRPKHPFFKILLSDLQGVDPVGYPVGTTGPGYVTRKFYHYNRIGFADAYRNKTDWSSNSPYFYKGELREEDDKAVYVPNSQYFMDKVDPVHVTEDGKFTRLCKSIETLQYLWKRACSEFYSRKHIRENKKYTFTIHHWYHLWEMKESTVKNLKKINIEKVVPNCILYNE